MPRDDRELSRAEMCVLALLAERPAHGWAVSRELEPGGEIGNIWSGDRQRVYRALRVLEARDLVEPAGLERGEGAHRTIYRATSQGTAELERWLLTPAPQGREGQATFLLKLAFARRAGIDPAPLVAGQRGLLAAVVERFAERVDESESDEEKLHLRLRLETSRVFLHFLEDLDQLDGDAPRTERAVPEPGSGRGGGGGGGGGRGRAQASGGPVGDAGRKSTGEARPGCGLRSLAIHSNEGNGAGPRRR